MNEIKYLKVPNQSWIDAYDDAISWYGGDIAFNSKDQIQYLKRRRDKFSRQILKELKNKNLVIVKE